MQQESNHTNSMMLEFLGGAVVGAIIVALSTPKAGHEVREDLKFLGRKVRGKVDQLTRDAESAWGEVKDRTSRAMGELKRGSDSATTSLRS